MIFRLYTRQAILVAILLVWGVAPCLAHPHILASVQVAVMYSDRAEVTAIRNSWTYDPFYAAFAKRQIDTNGDGKYSVEELNLFAKQQMGSLREFGFFTAVEAEGTKVEFDDPADYGLKLTDDGILTLAFVLPLKKAAMLSKQFTINIFDPHFFAYFTLADRAVYLIGAPQGCSTTATGPKSIDLTRPRSVPASFWAALDGATADNAEFVNRITVICK